MFTLEASWQAQLEAELQHSYMHELAAFIAAEQEAGKTIYPPNKQLFAAFDKTPINKLRVVILGQDPYHGANQAHGLSFSVPQGVAIPPSLRNMFQELATDTSFIAPQHGNLNAWASQGVLLLNSVLSVEAGLAASHQGKGWERFSDVVIQTINDKCENVVFMLWGSYAQRKGKAIDSSKHCVLTAPHPSPLSAYRGFFGCKHFSQANTYLVGQGKRGIDWQL